VDHSSRRLDRVLRTAGTPDLLSVLTDRLTPTDLQTLLLEVYRRRVGAVTPSRLLAQYESNRSCRRHRWRRSTCPDSTW
jgi:hypothetical protein